MQGIADIARLDGGLSEPALEDVSVEAVVGAVANEFRRDAQLKSIDYRIDLAPVGIRTDPALLTRVVRNLLSNAFKFTGSGGRVWIDATPEPGGARLHIGDTGPGIPEAEHDRIFEEYTSIDVERPQGRTRCRPRDRPPIY